jgi:hypothetical protein
LILAALGSTAIGAFSKLRCFSSFAFNFGKRRSYEFPVHVISSNKL